jgi:phosphoribosylformylglycinamidine synthase
VACTGATPVAATNCLNFGNPEKPEIMAQLSAAIDGIAEACTALGTPITGGNVSLYNETKGEGIYPTPVLGVVGILDDISKAVPAGFQHEGDDVLLLIFNEDTNDPSYFPNNGVRELGSSEFARQIFGKLWGVPPGLSLKDEAKLQRCLIDLANQKLLHSAKDSTDGAVFVALAEAGFDKSIGFESLADSTSIPMAQVDPSYYWAEYSSAVIVSCSASDNEKIIEIAKRHGASGAYPIGKTTPKIFRFHDRSGLPPFIDTTIADLKHPWFSALESHLHDQPSEVLA